MDPKLPTGIAAPDFTLQSIDGASYSLSDFRGQIVIINFWSVECGWSERADGNLLPLWKSWRPRVAWLTISSNPNEPDELVAQASDRRGLPLVLRDPDQAVADRYGADTTPQLFVVDECGILRYQGAFDDITFRRRTATQHYLQCAVVDLLEGELPGVAETAPYGCVIVRMKDGKPTADGRQPTA